jgi:hypothetical protein
MLDSAKAEPLCGERRKGDTMKVDGKEYCDVCQGSIIDEKWMRTPAGVTICSECLGAAPAAQRVVVEPISAAEEKPANDVATAWNVDIFHPFSGVSRRKTSPVVKALIWGLALLVLIPLVFAIHEALTSNDRNARASAAPLAAFLISLGITTFATHGAGMKTAPGWAKMLVFLVSFIAALVLVWMMFPTEYEITFSPKTPYHTMP